MAMLSRFNRYTQTNGSVIVYNTFSNSVIQLSDCNIEEAKAFIQEQEEGSQYHDLGFIITGDERRLIDAYIKNLWDSSNILNIMLILTYDCNCACPYCFEEFKHKCSTKDVLEVFSDVLEYISRLYFENNAQVLELHYFGGEPLLFSDKIRHAQSYFKEKNINVFSNVITNGTLLDRNTAQVLLESGVGSYQVTLDGPQFIHDLRRPLKNRSSAFERIVSNLRGLVDLDLNLSIRVNYDMTHVEHLPSLFNDLEFLKESKNTRIYVAPVVGVLNGTFKTTLEDRIKSTSIAWKQLKQSHLPYSIVPPSYSPCPIQSQNSAFYIDLFGNIFKCGGFVGRKEHIHRNIFASRDLKCLDSFPGIEEKCYSCSVLPVCMGGCAYETKQFNHSCQKNYLEKMMDEYYSEYFQEEVT